MLKRCTFFQFLASLTLLLLFSGGVAAEGNFIVSDIRIEGLERIPDGTLLNYLPIHEGDPVDIKQIS